VTRSEIIHNRLITCIYNGELENKEMVKIVHDLSDFLGLKTLTNYAKSEKISYQGALKRKNEFVKIDNVKFVIDNE